jgi:bifunctional non-homologous end joining protein LigD
MALLTALRIRFTMPRVVKRSASQSVESGPAQDAPLPQFVPPQLHSWSRSRVGPQRAHEIKLDGFRMAGRIDKGRAQLLTRTWLDWTEKSPAAVSALANREDRLRLTNIAALALIRL